MKTLMVDMDNVITNNRFTFFLEEFLNKELDFNTINIKYRQEVIEGREEELYDINLEESMFLKERLNAEKYNRKSIFDTENHFKLKVINNCE